jgi:hypothetical protein
MRQMTWKMLRRMMTEIGTPIIQRRRERMVLTPACEGVFAGECIDRLASYNALSRRRFPKPADVFADTADRCSGRSRSQAALAFAAATARGAADVASVRVGSKSSADTVSATLR